MHTEELVSSVPGAPHLWNKWMDAAKPSHTLQSLCNAMVLPPAAAKVLLLNLYLGQNPNSHQNLTYFLLILSHCMPLGRNPAPQVSSKIFPFSPALVWWFFPWQGCFLTLPNPILTAYVTKGQHSHETLSLPSRPLRYLFIFLPHKKMQRVVFANIK